MCRDCTKFDKSKCSLCELNGWVWGCDLEIDVEHGDL